MKKEILAKLKDSALSVLPITILVIIFSLFVVKTPTGNILIFLTGTLLLLLGLFLFTFGSSFSMLKLGEDFGRYLTKKKKIWLFLLVGFLTGIVITVAEPDLSVLSQRLLNENYLILVFTVAVGLGVFLSIALLRIIFQIRLSIILFVCYSIIILISPFLPKEFTPFIFDSGGVTTGPITVPFIISFGIGIASFRSEKNQSSDDTFGLIGIASIGPIIAVSIFGLVYMAFGGLKLPVQEAQTLTKIYSFSDFSNVFFQQFLNQLKNVIISMIPLFTLFIVTQVFIFKHTKKVFITTFIGFIIVYFGIVLFLTGAKIGFHEISYHIGNTIRSEKYFPILVPIGFVFGLVIVLAEPAIKVLNEQVEHITTGFITKRHMNMSLALGVGIAVMLAIIRAVWAVSILWIIIPGYIIAIVLSFITPRMFTAIAFDSGGVASGPLTANFLLPFAMGIVSQNPNANVYIHAFGMVSFVAMTPLITIQLLGLLYKYKLSKHIKEKLTRKENIIYFNWEDSF